VTAPRIAIVGSFSTGKTTLAEMAAEPLGLPLLPEVAREVAAEGFKLDKDATPEVETLIFLRQYRNEMRHPAFIADRSLLDVMAYAGWVLDHQERRREFALWDACLDVAEHRLRTQYTHVVYLPIEFPIVPDGLRPMDPEFQQDIDRRILELLDRYGIKYQTLTGSIEDRLAALNGLITAAKP
jgi:nicotinamide riboside kinase